MVGAVAAHLGAPADLAGLQVDGHHIGEARPGEEDEPPVGRGEAVVHVLVVALTDERADVVEEELAVGSALISAIRARLSGMTLMRLSRLNVCGSTRSAVPAQLLLTTSTSRVPLSGAADVVAGARAAVATIAETSVRGRGIRIMPRIMSAYRSPPAE